MLQQHIAVHLHARAQFDAHVLVIRRRPQTVNAGDAGDDNHVAPFDQRRRGGKAQTFDVLIDARILRNVGVRLRDVRFRQIVIVITDEVLNRVVRKERLEFAVELGGKGLVVRKNEHRTVQLRNDICERESFARPRHPLQGLEMPPAFQSVGKRLDRGGLIARRRIFGNQLKQTHAMPRFLPPERQSVPFRLLNQTAEEASEGILQSPRGERLIVPTFGPSGMQLRLNCCVKKRRRKVLSQVSI